MNEQGARLEANSKKIKSHSKLSESIAALALRNYAVHKDMASLSEDVKEYNSKLQRIKQQVD